ncbi:hypothetical protein ACH5RR_041016 [Cinchona calisaya]|uniref:DUF4283 domain-containing protein n=1 Tax=Cinchona calisaya TaxID=153742 RepID=A0ABD2XST6_9GENT
MRAMTSTLANAWNLQRAISFKVLGDNLALFQFNNDTDRKRVIQGASWVFDNKLVVLSEFAGDIQSLKTNAIYFFSFEELPNFYYYCSLLSHVERDSSTRANLDHLPSSFGFQYGAWFRVSNNSMEDDFCVDAKGDEMEVDCGKGRDKYNAYFQKIKSHLDKDKVSFQNFDKRSAKLNVNLDTNSSLIIRA